MAKQTTVTLVDDMDGSVAEETIRFALDGVAYEIDLNAKHAKSLRAALERYVAAGRRTGKPVRARRASGSRSDAEEIRAWARANGHKVSERGRISEQLREAYLAAR